MGKILEFKDAPQTKTPGVRTTSRLVHGDWGAKRIEVTLVEYEPRAGYGHYHYHEERETVFIVLEGGGTLKLNGVEHQLKPNTVAFIPPGDKHHIMRAGEEGLKLLAVISPLEGEDMIPVQE